MSLPKELDHCPATPECTARKLYQTEDGKLFKYDLNTGKFKPHVCSANGIVSTLPRLVFSGEFLNLRTGRTRYTGPTRLRSSALKPPADSSPPKGAKYDKKSEWKLVQLHYDELDWKPVKD